MINVILAASLIATITTVRGVDDNCQLNSKQQILACSNIRDLPKLIDDKVKQLVVTRSELPKIKKDAFAGLRKLRRIDAQFSGIEDMDDLGLRGLEELSSLRMANNRLAILRGAWFKRTPKIAEIDLRNNRIKSVQANFATSVPRLLALDLRGNRLTMFPVEFVVRLTRVLKKLELYGNPLHYRQILQAVERHERKSERNAINPGYNEALAHMLELTRECARSRDWIDKSTNGINKCVELKLDIEIAKIIPDDL